MKHPVSRAYNRFSFDSLRSTITKKSKERRLHDETVFYELVSKVLSVYFPRKISSGYEAQTNEYFLELEYYPYSNLGQYLIGEKELTHEQWTLIAKSIYNILQEFSNVKDNKALYNWDFQSMYFVKTDREYKKLATKFDAFKQLTQYPKLTINNQLYENFEHVWPKVKERFGDVLVMKHFLPCVMHGDCCFSNILLGGFVNDSILSNPIIRFVDPRGTFGTSRVFGDPYYDLAKLMHSTDVGYEYFIYDKFDVVQDMSPEKFVISYDNDNKRSVHDIFRKHIYSKFDEKKIKLIQGLIFIGMCARHYDNPKRQLAMYLSGVRILNEVLKE